MLDETAPDPSLDEAADQATPTLYKLATDAILYFIPIYLELAEKSEGFSNLKDGHVTTEDQRRIVLVGIGSSLDPETASAKQVVQEWRHSTAIPFDVERAVTAGVYLRLRAAVDSMLDELEVATKGFTEFDSSYISQNPHYLPLFQRLADISSKAELKRLLGNASDNSISTPVAIRLSELLNRKVSEAGVNRGQLLQSVEPTLEGIVRDLVGRVLLESVVANALDKAGVPYKRENEYRHLKGVVYDFRADFVIPDEVNPKAFIEVRKSSSRHASLYAKDKMFSAINWKGETRDLLAVLVVEGPWTAETLRTMANVFDYVTPLSRSPEVAKAISAYLAGDTSKLRWLIDFSISRA